MTQSAPPVRAVPEIRPFRAADRADVLELWRASGIASPNSTPEQDLELCLNSPHACLFVAVAAGAVVATAIAGYDGNRGWLHRVAVARERRRRGIARMLASCCEAWLTERGVPKVNLQITADNVGAQAFWERAGFTVEPRISMGKRLPPFPVLPGPASDAPPGQLRVVTTYLEMNERPRISAPPTPAGLKLAVFRADAISVPFYRYLYNTVGRPWLWYERRRLSDAELASQIHDKQVDVFVLYASGEPAGFFELDRRTSSNIELAYFGLMPHWIGRGLGSFLLNWAIDTAWQNAPRRLWVHTCNLDHPKAIAFYQRAGFAPYKQETKFIADPRPLP